MLDTNTKRRIDTARDILVGVVTNPISQVEQISIAMIFKFMDDMDKESIALGGKATFFTGKYKQYSWSNIFSPKIGGTEMLKLYGDALEKLNEAAQIPQLFRDIFKNAYLPYRNPETLKLFLKTINEFDYNKNSEQLGDAFEHLLSILGSQGDAGQFRTPRHIIDFIVEVLDPKKNETILDPACGTAGFLISAFKHILKQNGKKKPGDVLSSSDRTKLMQNFYGYELDPTMKRFSLVNMYLHEFPTPKIFEYDTLSSEDRWNDYFDVILANPPFMSPKGGITPHKRFSIQANRSEVLFVDYIAEHINPVTGRAGIIVPEGIIFQSANAYKDLRKMLIEKNYLYAVVSLPAGVFNPYSGVKTSILLFDKTLAKTSDEILFVKIDNDGFDLGAQRRSIEKNDLTAALQLLNEYKQSLIDNTIFKSDNKNVFVVKKKTIAATGDYNLSVDRFRVNENVQKSDFEMVSLEFLADFVRGVTYSKDDEVTSNGSKILRSNNIDVNTGKLDLSDIKQISKSVTLNPKQILVSNDIFICTASGSTSHIGKVAFIDENTEYYFGGFMGVLRCNARVDPRFLFYHLRGDRFNAHLNLSIAGANIKNLKSEILNSFFIPLPCIQVQQEIVNKIELYQKIIDGAKQVTENYKPQIDIDESYPIVLLGDICRTQYGYTEIAKEKGTARYIRITDINEDGTLRNENLKFVNLNEQSKECLLRKGDLVVARTGATYGKTLLFEESYSSVFASFLIRLLFDNKKILNKFYWYFTQSEDYNNQKGILVTGGGQPQFNANAIIKIRIPLPPVAIQCEIIARIEAEQQLVNANKQLIQIFEQKIKDEINKLWQKAPEKNSKAKKSLDIV